MKYLVDICLIIAMWVILYITDGWWQLLTILPFIGLLAHLEPGRSKKKKQTKNRIEDSDCENYYYEVTDSHGDIHNIECKCPAQFEGQWVHLVNEISEYGFHDVEESFYKPIRVKHKSQISQGNISSLN